MVSALTAKTKSRGAGGYASIRSKSLYVLTWGRCGAIRVVLKLKERDVPEASASEHGAFTFSVEYFECANYIPDWHNFLNIEPEMEGAWRWMPSEEDNSMVSLKLTQKMIESVVTEVAGQDVIPLIQALKNKKNVSEFAIADETETEINATRNMLYRLYNMNLVSFTRKKDKKKGWYIYYWTFNPDRVKNLFVELKLKRLEMLQERLERERSSHFFVCPDRCIRLDFEQATDFNFKCPECGKLLSEDDNAKKILELEKESGSLNRELKQLGVRH